MAPNRAELKDIAVALCLEGDDEYRETLLLVISIHNYHKLQKTGLCLIFLPTLAISFITVVVLEETQKLQNITS